MSDIKLDVEIVDGYFEMDAEGAAHDSWRRIKELVEEKLKSTNSDYTAAIRAIKEYCQSRPDSTMVGVFRVWCEDQRR